MAKQAEKHRRILAAATEIFLRDGFEGARMETITAAAGVSKATVYAHFPTKDALFVAIMRERCAALVPYLEERRMAEGSPTEVLSGIGEAFLAQLLNPVNLDLFRVVVAEAPRQPALARAFYLSGPDRLADALARYFAAAAADGRIAVAAPRIAAEQFLGMLLGHLHLRLLLGVAAKPPGVGERRRLVADAVARFLGAPATAGAASEPGATGPPPRRARRTVRSRPEAAANDDLPVPHEPG